MKVLFICTGNTCRSPMAEGLLKDMAKKNNLETEVKSAGVFADDGGHVSENALSALEEMGIDISNHRSQSVNKELVEQADLILTMSKSHKESLILNYPHIKEKVFLLNEYAFDRARDIADPFGKRLSDYKIVRDEIMRALSKIKWE